MTDEEKRFLLEWVTRLEHLLSTVFAELRASLQAVAPNGSPDDDR
jgi:hypothetical protein